MNNVNSVLAGVGCGRKGGKGRRKWKDEGRTEGVTSVCDVTSRCDVMRGAA